MLRLIALVLPLGLDTFAVSTALGMLGLTGRQRLRFGILFAVFEAGMPVVGLAVGFALGSAIGAAADYVAIAGLAGLGLYMLFGVGEQDEKRIETFATSRGFALIGIGLSVSLDELAIGFTLGLLRVPIAPALLLIALQAFVVSQVGFRIGSRVAESVRDWAERMAGVVLIGFAGVLLLSKFVPIPI